MRGFFSSQRVLVFNAALLSIVLGFVVGVSTFSCTTSSPIGGNVVAAQDRGPSGVSALEAMQYSFREVAAKVLPVVVEIDVVDIVEQDVPRSPFDFFFGPRDRGGDSPREFRSQGLGSGVIVRRNGKQVYILTNNHVVGEAEEIKIILNDKREFQGRLVGGDSRKDLALVVFETGEDVPVAELGDSDTLQVGDWALAVGNPLGLDSTITAGIISALGRRGGPGENISEFIQTDAAISPGNSGGALVNLWGQVIGINTWIASNTGANQGYGFAIPVNSARKAIEDFIELGHVQYAWLGVQIQTPNEEIAKDLGISGKRGALVSQVFRGAPADKGGILPGDLIISLNGRRIGDHLELTDRLGDQPAGLPSRFLLIRQGKEVELGIRLAVRDDERAIAAQNKNLWPGMAVFPMNQDLRKELGVKSSAGVVIYDVLDATPAHTSGFKPQDVLIGINGRAVGSLKDFYAALAAGGKLVFTVEREGAESAIELIQ